MFYSQILPLAGHTEEQGEEAVNLLRRVMISERPAVSSYDFMMLKTCVEVMQKGVQTEFENDDAYFDSEFVSILTANLETIAHFNSYGDCTWYLNNPAECSPEDLEMGYYQDEFAMMHLDSTVQELIKLHQMSVGAILGPIALP